jgi:hypothetical protein
LQNRKTDDIDKEGTRVIRGDRSKGLYVKRIRRQPDRKHSSLRIQGTALISGIVCERDWDTLSTLLEESSKEDLDRSKEKKKKT